MTDRDGTSEPGGADEIAAAHDALHTTQEASGDAQAADADDPT